jgi:hypothetical protein
MSAAHSPANSALFGNEGHLSVSRTLSELQGRRPVRINAPGEVLFTLPVEGLDDQRLCEFVALCSPNAPELIVTQQRARAIGIEASTPMASPLSREVASEASIPLASGAAARFVVFRDALGVDQVAIIIGKPNFAEPIPVRLHSACLTGDVFGSRRCDCGDQLQLALTRLESLGGGVVLYLAKKAAALVLRTRCEPIDCRTQGWIHATPIQCWVSRTMSATMESRR